MGSDPSGAPPTPQQLREHLALCPRAGEVGETLGWHWHRTRALGHRWQHRPAGSQRGGGCLLAVSEGPSWCCCCVIDSVLDACVENRVPTLDYEDGFHLAPLHPLRHWVVTAWWGRCVAEAPTLARNECISCCYCLKAEHELEAGVRAMFL